MVLVAEKKDNSSITQNYALENGAEGEITDIMLSVRRYTELETLYPTENEWKTMFDGELVPGESVKKRK